MMKNVKLNKITGINSAIEQRLRSVNINSVEDLANSTRTARERSALAEKIDCPPENVSYWAAQAELMRVEGMDSNTASELINAGVYSVSQLQKINSTEIVQRVLKVKPSSAITASKLQKYKITKPVAIKTFECDDLEEEMLLPGAKVPAIYSNLSTVIAELGKGIAQAQLALDESSIEIQNKILASDDLYNMGLQATWYVMPEAEFTMKMDYSISKEKTASGKVVSTNLHVAPNNPTINNLFKASQNVESSVRLKFVPIPAANRMTTRRFMPDLTQVASYAGLLALLEEREIENFKILPEDAFTWGEVPIRVTAQSINSGAILKIGDTPVITIAKNEEA